MPRYDRDDYSACDWRQTKSDVLRNKRAIAKRRRWNLANLLGILLVLVVIVVTLDGIWGMLTN